MIKKKSISWEFVNSRIDEMVKGINNQVRLNRKIKIFGIPSGGKFIEGLIVTRNLFRFKAVNSPQNADIIVDDIYDSGNTYNRYSKYEKPIWILVDKREDKFKDKWITLPWDCKEKDNKETKDYALRLIQKNGYSGTVKILDDLLNTPQKEVLSSRGYGK